MPNGAPKGRLDSMTGRIPKNLYESVRGTVAVALVALGAVACGGDRTGDADAPGDAVAAADSARGPGVSVVALVDLAIRSAPDPSAPAVRDVTAGTGLALTPPGAEPAPAGWVQVSTWDDRRGWVPAADLLDIALWGHYQAALGGTPPTALRPAYPAGGEGWVVEAPFHSPGFSSIATVWLAGDTLHQTRVAEIDTLANECSGDRYRFARLAGGLGAGTGPMDPDVDAAVLAVASVERPTLGRLAIRPLESPDAALEAAVAGAVETLLEGAAAAARDPAGPPPAPGSRPAATWHAVGDAAAWVTLSWEPAADAVEFGRWAAAFLVLRAAPAGAATAGEPPSVRIAIPLTWTSVGESSAPFDVRAAYSTGPGLHPTLFVVHSWHYEGVNVSVYLAGADALRRVYLGYYWGC